MIQVRCLCDNRMFKTVAVSVLLISTVLGQHPLLSVSQNQVDLNSSLTVMCEIATNAEIRFLVDNNQVGSCPPDYVSQDCSPPEIQQNTTAGLTTWTLTATVAYEGIWTCDKSFVQSNTETINMYKCPNTIISESGINSDMVVSGTETVHISFKIGCIYPTSNPDIWLRFLQSNSSTAPYKSLNCRETADSCATGSVYRCNQDISYKMNVANGSLELGYNYTLYIDSVVSPSIGTCDRLALFEPYSLQFEEGGGNSGNGDDNCNVLLIIVCFFAVSFIVMTITFIVVLLLSCKFPNIGKVVIIGSFLVIDVVFEITILWGIEYESNFNFFKSDCECPVVLIGVICHFVTLLIEVVKAVVLYHYMNKLKKRFFGTCISPEGKPTEKLPKDVVDRKARSNFIFKGSGDGSPPSAEDRTENEAKPEDVMILMHFTVPEGYSVDSWATEKTSSINDISKYRPSDRGSLCIKAASKKDNGIYQSILKSNNSEQRINAVLHVTEQKSVSLVIHPLIWRQLSSKKLKKINELKDVRHKLSNKKIDDIEIKKEDKSNVSVKSVRWKHNGRGIPSNYNTDDKEVPPLEVIKKDPIDEYHCTVQFSNKKSHVYIFIVKFTGAQSGNTQSSTLAKNKVDTTSEDVIGVPTIMNTKREEIIPSLPPIRHTGTTASANQDPESSPVQGNDLHQVTARSTQSTGTEVDT